MSFSSKITSYKCFAHDPLVSGGIAKIRNMMINELCEVADVNAKHCRQYDIYIFHWGQPNESGSMVVDFGERFNDKIRQANKGSLNYELNQAERENLKKILPEIDTSVNKALKKAGKEADFKLLSHDSVITGFRARLNFQFWFVEIEYSMEDGFRDWLIYPEKNPKFVEWQSLPEPRPKFQEFIKEQMQQLIA